MEHRIVFKFLIGTICCVLLSSYTLIITRHRIQIAFKSYIANFIRVDMFYRLVKFGCFHASVFLCLYENVRMSHKFSSHYNRVLLFLDVDNF